MAGFASWWIRCGWTGVDLFFVLSGFLVGGLLFQEIKKTKSLDVVRFWIRRGFKIWPAYIVFVAYLLVGHVLKYPDWTYALKQVWPNLLHVQNYFGSPRIHSWSLSVEEHFYLLMPILLLLGVRLHRGKSQAIPLVPLAALALMIACLLARWQNSLHHPFNYLTHLFPSHLRFDSLFCGVFLAYAYNFHRHWLAWIARFRLLTLGLSGVLLSPLFFVELEKSVFMQTLGLTSIYLGYAGLLLVMIMKPEQPGRLEQAFQLLATRWIAFVGYYSYSIYLWHMDVGYRPAHRLYASGLLAPLAPGWQYMVTALAYVLCSVVGGAALGALIEMPALAIRDRIFPSRVKMAFQRETGGGQAPPPSR